MVINLVIALVLEQFRLRDHRKLAIQRREVLKAVRTTQVQKPSSTPAHELPFFVHALHLLSKMSHGLWKPLLCGICAQAEFNSRTRTSFFCACSSSAIHVIWIMQASALWHVRLKAVRTTQVHTQSSTPAHEPLFLKSLKL